MKKTWISASIKSHGDTWWCEPRRSVMHRSDGWWVMRGNTLFDNVVPISGPFPTLDAAKAAYVMIYGGE